MVGPISKAGGGGQASRQTAGKGAARFDEAVRALKEREKVTEAGALRQDDKAAAGEVAAVRQRTLTELKVDLEVAKRNSEAADEVYQAAQAELWKARQAHEHNASPQTREEVQRWRVKLEEFYNLVLEAETQEAEAQAAVDRT